MVDLHGGPPNIIDSLENTALSCKVDVPSGANCSFPNRRDEPLQETAGRIQNRHAKKCLPMVQIQRRMLGVLSEADEDTSSILVTTTESQRKRTRDNILENGPTQYLNLLEMQHPAKDFLVPSAVAEDSEGREDTHHAKKARFELGSPQNPVLLDEENGKEERVLEHKNTTVTKNNDNEEESKGAAVEVIPQKKHKWKAKEGNTEVEELNFILPERVGMKRMRVLDVSRAEEHEEHKDTAEEDLRKVSTAVGEILEDDQLDA